MRSSALPSAARATSAPWLRASRKRSPPPWRARRSPGPLSWPPPTPPTLPRRSPGRPLEPKQGLVVTVAQDGKIYMDEAALSYEDFRATFPAFVRTKRPHGVYLRADQRVPYGSVVQVLAVIRAAGVTDVGLVAAAEDPGGGRAAPGGPRARPQASREPSRRNL